MQNILKCNPVIALDSFHNYQKMNLKNEGVPAILAYKGIQYQYMAPHIFTDEMFAYVQEHVFILSGLYGALRALDEVIPYRLELNNSFAFDQFKSLYDFWKEKPYHFITQTDDIILDLTSVQYGKIIKKYRKANQRYTRCSFMEVNETGAREKGVYVKMARGAMVRYLAQNQIQSLEEVKQFKELGYLFQPALSDDVNFVFTRKDSNVHSNRK